MSSALPEIVVGIDFGTTHSGVSWAVNGGTKAINVISDWPHVEMKTASHLKVPSNICYKDGKPHTWGYNIDPNEKQCFKWIKVLLEQDKQYQDNTIVRSIKESSKTLLRDLDLTAEDVVADYLQSLWEYTLKHIRKHRFDFDESTYSFRIILTVPALWSHSAKDRTMQAALKAGIPKDITLLAEPEAAALATLREKADEEVLKVGDVFVICDAGGGTVDLISYEITNLNPLQFHEQVEGKGDLCGAVMLDISFQSLVITLIGEQQWARLKDKWKHRMMSEFDYRIKKSFNDDVSREYSIDLQGIEDDKKHGISDETINFQRSSLRAIFSQVTDKIDRLVCEQISAVREKNLNAKAILLVGGFGSSKFLHEYLENNHKHESIKVYQISEPWASICRGATMWGLENSDPTKWLATGFQKLEVHTITSRVARYSYGICVAEIFDETKHLLRDQYTDSRGLSRAQNQMQWLQRKGASIVTNKVLTTAVSRPVTGLRITMLTKPLQFEMTLYYCSELHPPTRIDERVKKLCTVTCKVDASSIMRHEESYKNMQDGKKYRDAEVQVCIKLLNTSLRFDVKYRAREVGSVDAKYIDSTA